MYKKILSCICIGIIFISILNPLKIKAYSNELDNYIDSDLTPEQMEDAIGSSIIGYLLGAGAEFIVPGSGQTVQNLYDEINDIIDESIDIKNNIVSWFQDKQIRFENPHLWLPMYWDTQYSYDVDSGPIADAANYYLQRKAEMQDEPVTPNYPVNYLPYIELINGKSFNYQYLLTDNWISTLSDSNLHLSNIRFLQSPDSISYKYYKNASIASWNNSGSSEKIATFENNKYSLKESYGCLPVNIYINLSNNVYYCTTSTLTYVPIVKNNNNNAQYYEFACLYDRSTNKTTQMTTLKTSVPNLSWSYSSSSLEDCFKVIALNWRNVNIFVNGDPWTSMTPPPDPIDVGGHTYLTNTNLPVEFKFPEGTLNDLALIKSILHQLIDLNNTGNAISIQIDDILEAFTDEYGNQAMYVVVIHRNDYDQLVYEQYPYNVIPNKVHGIYFPENQINGYVDEMTYITKTAGSDLIPNDILVILGAGGVLLLIAFLINRLLE